MFDISSPSSLLQLREKFWPEAKDFAPGATVKASVQLFQAVQRDTVLGVLLNVFGLYIVVM